MIGAKVSLTQALKSRRQFVAETGTGHRLIVERAIQLSEEQYRSVRAMLRQTARFETQSEIHEESTPWLASNELAGQVA